MAEYLFVPWSSGRFSSCKHKYTLQFQRGKKPTAKMRESHRRWCEVYQDMNDNVFKCSFNLNKYPPLKTNFVHLSVFSKAGIIFF
jgi:hypothetical protein